MALQGVDDMEKLKNLSAKPYKDQATFVLNAFWETKCKDAAEDVFAYTQQMIELDEKSGKDGCELDELTAHRYLEKFSETLTVRELREALRLIDIDTNKMMSLAEYLIHRLTLDWHALVNSSQKANSAELIEAERLCNLAREKMEAAVAIANEARAAENAVKQALAELHAQEKAFQDKLDDLKARTQTGGIVSRNKAANELAQAKNEDPLPLQRAKINQGATVRQAEKARAAVEPAEKEAIDSFNAADEYLKDVASRSGSSQGGIWWLQKELDEAKRYLPQSKGGVI